MEKTQRKSLKYAKRHSILKQSNNQSKSNSQKESYEIGLSKIFSSPPSHLGYTYDIESLINELELKNDQLLSYVISSLSKIVRNKNEIKIIASYLYLMPNFIKLLKGQDIDKKEQDILKDLLTLSQSISYEKHQKDTILMRFGDKGSTAYIILDGKVDVFIKSFKIMNITKNDYLLYLATLLKYSEYGLLNEAINENFKVFPMEIYDSTNIKHLNINGIEESPEKNVGIKGQNKTTKNLGNSPVKNDNLFQSSKTLNNLDDNKVKSNDDRHNSSFNSLFKLNEENEEIKEYKSIFSISINNLMKMFNLKKLDKKNSKLNNCSVNELINRIELIPEHYKICINKNLVNSNNININTISNKTDNEKDSEKDNIPKKEFTDNDSDDEKIFNYIKVATLSKGTLFGEIALRDANSFRTGTLITSSECHFTVLSKRLFDNCLKKGAEKYLKELLSFFINLPIFNGIPESLFYHKYYTYLSKKILLRGNLVITQGEKPKDIIMIQTGSYGLTTRISLFDLTKLIYHFINMNLKNKNNVYDEDNIKYNNLLKKTKNFMVEAKALMNENLKFKKFYLSEILIRVTDISCPDIVGYKEYVDENGLYAFSIETKSPENIIFTLDNKFYSDLQHRNYTVRTNQKELLEKKNNAIIQRLLIIRNSLVNSYFDDQGEKKISSLIMKEIENMNNIKLKQKRFLKFKSTECKFNKKALEDKAHEVNKSFNNNNKNDVCEKSKKIKIVSRNHKINNNDAEHFNSFNIGEEKQKEIKKSIKQYYKIYPNSNQKQTNNKINKKIINLYKASKNYYSTKNILGNKQIIRKKNILEVDSKEKTQISKHTLKEYSFKYRLNQDKHKNNTESKDSKTNKEIEDLKKDNLSPLTSPKLSSANNSQKAKQIKGVMFNSLVWEEIKTKINKKITLNNEFINKMNLTQRNNKLKNYFEKSNSFRKINNEEIKSPFNSGRYSSSRIRFNEQEKLKYNFFNNPSLLHKSSSELNFKNNLRIKSNFLKKINTPKYTSSYDISKRKNRTIDNNNLKRYYSPPDIRNVPKINLKIKKIFSPEQIKLIREINKKRNDINIMKYHESKIEKYKIDRNFYYNNNLKNRIKLFYSIEKK